MPFSMPKFLRYSGTSILGPQRPRTSFQFDLQHSNFDLTIARWKRNFKKRRGRRKICEKVCAFERKKQASHLSWCKMHLDVWKSRSSHSHSNEKDLHWEKNPFIHGKNTIMIWRKVFKKKASGKINAFFFFNKNCLNLLRYPVSFSCISLR